MNNSTHYPSYDVMQEVEAWDDHTREIVKKRLEPDRDYQFFNHKQIELFSSIAATLIDDPKEDRISFIIYEVDRRLHSKIGESQRKINTPPEDLLIKQGLAALAATAKDKFGKDFSTLALPQRQTLLGQLERQEFPNTGLWQGLPQSELFKKLLELIVESYYSHPRVWSEIGYGGPAYPRGYVRAELGLTDPWEAQPEQLVAERSESVDGK